MAGTTPTGTTVAEVMAELAELEDPKARAVNEKHGDDHGVNLSRLRALAKRLKTQQDLARGLWETDDTATGSSPSSSAARRRSGGTSWTPWCARPARPRSTTGS